MNGELETNDGGETVGHTSVNDGGENLDMLALEAESIDAVPSAGAQAADDAQAAQNAALTKSNSAELLVTLMMARGLSLPILPKRKAELLADVWTDEVLAQAANAGGVVLALHGQSMGNVLGKYAPYIVLLGVLVRPVLDTREILTTPDPRPAPVQGPAHG
jgi:hypothetical protein